MRERGALTAADQPAPLFPLVPVWLPVPLVPLVPALPRLPVCPLLSLVPLFPLVPVAAALPRGGGRAWILAATHALRIRSCRIVLARPMTALRALTAACGRGTVLVALFVLAPLPVLVPVLPLVPVGATPGGRTWILAAAHGRAKRRSGSGLARAMLPLQACSAACGRGNVLVALFVLAPLLVLVPVLPLVPVGAAPPATTWNLAATHGKARSGRGTGVTRTTLPLHASVGTCGRGAAPVPALVPVLALLLDGGSLDMAQAPGGGVGGGTHAGALPVIR